MKERPILFSAPMVRAILSGAKTQTRRVVKWPVLGPSDGRKRRVFTEQRIEAEHVSLLGACPYKGPRLWVGETWSVGNWNPPGRTDIAISYHADGHAEWLGQRCPLTTTQIDEFAQRYGRPSWKSSPWKPSIHMPRWASRITLEVTGVRVERVQDISEEDAKAEGVESIGITFRKGEPGVVPSLGGPKRDGFRILWSDINGAGSWDANPWCWVINFQRVEQSAALAEAAS